MIMKPNEDKTSIVLEKVGARDATFEQFKAGTFDEFDAVGHGAAQAL
jgi:hypothetical protein